MTTKTTIVTTYGNKKKTFFITNETLKKLGTLYKNPNNIEPIIANEGFQTVNITNAIASHPNS